MLTSTMYLVGRLESGCKSFCAKIGYKWGLLTDVKHFRVGTPLSLFCWVLYIHAPNHPSTGSEMSKGTEESKYNFFNSWAVGPLWSMAIYKPDLRVAFSSNTAGNATRVSLEKSQGVNTPWSESESISEHILYRGLGGRRQDWWSWR